MKVQELFAGIWEDGGNYAKIVPILQKNGFNIVCLHDAVSSSAAGRNAPGGLSLPATNVHDGAIPNDAGTNQNIAALVFVAAFSEHDRDAISGLMGPNGFTLPSGRVKLIADAIKSWMDSRTEFATGGLAPWQTLRVKALIEARLGERLTTTDFAAAVCLSEGHFARAFRRSFGEPPHLYLLRRRIDRAKQLMRNTQQTLSEIALSCGLSDQAHLSRIFRRFEGETPNGWRRRSSPPLQENRI